MKLHSFFALTAAFFFPLAFASAESADEIVKTFEKQKMEALTAYLEANPAAADRTEALAHLVEAHTSLGNSDKITALLEQRYEALEKGAKADLADLIGRVVQPLFASYTESGDKDKARALIEKVRADLADHDMAPQVGQFLDQLGGGLSAPSKGDTMEIAFTDVNGAEFDLAKMKGKVVLVDFWATWCGPCVQEMPNVIAAYQKYHKKGFEIVGISLDSDKDRLLQFTKDNEMTWPQYFDGKGWENDLAGKFGIRSIPATFLVGKDGKIAAADLRGPALEEKLEDLLK